MTETNVEQLFGRLGVLFVNRSYGKVTTKTVTLNCLTEAINRVEFSVQLRIVTTDTGFFKPGLKGKITGASERVIYVGPPGHTKRTVIPEFAVELDNGGGKHPYCQYGRDFLWEVKG